MNDEIKGWKAQSMKYKIAFVLMSDGASFHYNEENGIAFSAPESYVKNMAYRLMTCYSCSLKPVMTEY